MEAGRIVVGCWQLSEGHGAPFDREAVLQRLEALVAEGFTSFDCADIYTGVEALLGELRARTRANVRIHTKLVPDRDALDGLQRDYVARVVERSLRRLRAETLDLVQFHWWDFAVPGWVEALGWLHELQQEGKLRRLGVTNFDAAHLRPVVEAGIGVSSNQVQYSLLDRRPERSLVPFCREHGIDLLTYGTLAGGFLSESWLGAADPGDAPGNRSLVKYRLIIEELGGWSALQSLLRQVAAVAAEHAVPLASVAMRWVLERPGVAAVIAGFSPRHDSKSWRTALELRLGERDARRIEQALAALGTVPSDVYGVERIPRGRHAAIMRTDLNRP